MTGAIRAIQKNHSKSSDKTNEHLPKEIIEKMELRRLAIRATLSGAKGKTIKVIAKKLGLIEKIIQDDLTYMMNAGLVVRTSKGLHGFSYRLVS